MEINCCFLPNLGIYFNYWNSSVDMMFYIFSLIDSVTTNWLLDIILPMNILNISKLLNHWIHHRKNVIIFHMDRIDTACLPQTQVTIGTVCYVTGFGEVLGMCYIT
jgi:hypothetical protein